MLQDENIAKERAENLSWWIQILLRASVVGSRRRLWQVLRVLTETVDECRRDFDLRAAVDGILATCLPRPPRWDPAGFSSPRLAQLADELKQENIRRSRGLELESSSGGHPIPGVHWDDPKQPRSKQSSRPPKRKKV
jgi:hypothetical protein